MYQNPKKLVVITIEGFLHDPEDGQIARISHIFLG